MHIIGISMRLLTDRTALIQAVDRLSNQGGFAVKLGELALLADQNNLKRLVDAFPDHFIPNRTLRIVHVERNNNLLEGHR
jgi:hypothetical protein